MAIDNKIFSMLVVDDDENLISSLIELLNSVLDNWFIDFATNGYKAIEKAKQIIYDVVLMDVKMPGIDGIQTFKEIKKLSPTTIIILISGGDIQSLQSLQQQGVYNFLQKPIDINNLVKILSNLEKNLQKEKISILIIEDNENDLFLLQNIFLEKDYNVLTATTGMDGIEYFKQYNFDVIILDQKLPDMTGTEIIKKMKEYKHPPPIVVITGYSLNEVIMEDIYTCFLKPFKVELILKEIDSLGNKIKSRRITEEIRHTKILIVEDDENIRESTKDILEENNYSVDTASSFEEAVNKLEKENYNLVISDLSLGKDKTGLELVDIAKNKNKFVVFLLITGQATLESAVESIKKGVDEYILKPINPNELIHKVRTHLEKQRFNIEKEKLAEQLKEVNIKLLTLSVTDELTGVYNRRYLFERLYIEIQRAKRRQTDLALMMCDIDNFKSYNDKYGHIEGDRLLREVALFIKLNVRNYIDYVFRYGGDEFVILLCEIDKEDAQGVAQRIVSKFRNSFSSKGIGISIGLVLISGVEVKDKNVDIKEVIELADKKLYECKKIGGNTFVE
ncbi:MAG: response regulator [Elusimicrobiota bacterium]|nr:response regulator [Endomicrobiia bacterium]MDW8166469.1 response regulator [Elusimicrobiota bacterium]